ncbi:oligosaccharide flippase family protein [Roseateles sp.]|uniref:oligosaccharide flippase family protein n=1 Tax=Roseateles sp. TaxID=1971397 RepID=UPI003BA51B5A
MSSVRRSLAIAFIERYLLIAVSLGSSMLLARLLTPEEIGLYSVNLVFIGVAHMLRDFGISNFLVQAPVISRTEIRTAFGISLLLGGLLFLALCLAAPLIADFYKDPRLTDTLRICALNFLILPFNSVPSALMRRDMQFQRLVYITLTAAVLGTLTTIGLAFIGTGPNSMAIGALVTSTVTAIGTYAARADFRGLLPSLSNWRPIANFGGQSALTSVVTSVSMDMPELVAGKVLGFAPVAMLSRAQGLMNMIHRDLISAVRGVAFPAFARTFRAGGDVEAQHVQSVVNMTALAWPAYGLLGIHAADFIHIMFGAQWTAAAPLVPVFCLAGAFAALSALTSSQLMAIGRIDLVTRTELIVQPAKAAILVATLLVTQSMTAFAFAFLLANTASIPLIYWFKARAMPIQFRSMGKGLVQSAACTLGPLLIALTFSTVYRDEGGRIGPALLAASLASAGLLWFVGISLFKHPLSGEVLYRRSLRLIGLAREPR